VASILGADVEERTSGSDYRVRGEARLAHEEGVHAMLIRSRMGVSVDGFVATAEGVPTLVLTPDFVPGVSHGFPDFIDDCDAVLMGRTTFLPALGAPEWPWRGLQVFVMTSSPLPAQTPAGVVTVSGGPEQAVERLRNRGSDKDVHVVGGPLTIRGLVEAGALDRLEIVVLPLILGDGVPLSPQGTGTSQLRLLGEPRVHPDGSVELVYDIRRP
jgi:dihydrofolate reductase